MQNPKFAFVDISKVLPLTSCNIARYSSVNFSKILKIGFFKQERLPINTGSLFSLLSQKNYFDKAYSTSNNSTSKSKSEYGGIEPAAFAPYPSL
jgi:hypothetical protein